MPETFKSVQTKPKSIRLYVPEGASRKIRLELYKKWIAQEDRRLLKLHESTTSGLKVAKARSNTIDQLLQHLYHYNLKRFEKENGVLPFPTGIVALGGYGRAEMCPGSDVDIMFLYSERINSKLFPQFQKVFAERVLYILWDLKLKVGHSTRTIKQTMEEAKADVQSKNAMLESRLVAGSNDLFRVWQQAYLNFCKKNAQQYVEQRLFEQQKRREKHGGVVFIQEPDIKNGPGGLRDYQNLLWISLIKLNTASLSDLVDHGYLSKEERLKLRKAYDFLLRTRNQLHFQSPRPTDLMTFEHQAAIAKAFHYEPEDPLKQVEAFMRDYYRNLQNIYRLSGLLEHRLALIRRSPNSITFREVIGSRRKERPRIIDGFVVRGKELTQVNRQIFKKDPLRLIRVFRHCQQLDVRPDFDLTNLIANSIALIDQSVIEAPEANETFRSILAELGNVFPVLSSMHELGVLGKFLPDFDRLTCLVQHEYFHRYTADIHTLNTIKELDALLTEGKESGKPYRHEFHKLEDPSILYLILLLHDIGKGVSLKGHDKIGVEISRPILRRMGLNSRLSDKILFIIGNHLEMARFWQRHDIDDPQTVRKFARLVESLAHLRLLFLHTYCDARGTSSSLWNEYKDMLHRRLFSATRTQLASDGNLELELREQKEHMYRKLLSQPIPGVEPEEIHAHCNLLPERYFVNNSEEEIILHARMVNQLLRNINQANSMAALSPVIRWRDDINRGLTVVTLVTWDRSGLFYRLAGSFSLANLNIVSAKAINRMDHITIDTFYVSDAKGGVVERPSARKVFEKCIERSVVQNKDLTQRILTASQETKSPLFRSERRTRTPFPQTVDVYHEVELNKNIIEIQAVDKIGLLYFLAKCIYQNGYDITFARISTERDIAVDTFYIENSRDRAGYDNTTNLLALKESLSKVIDSGNPKVSD
ncbi:MAG: [protein-PII] uridylyltransferase [Opitutae bacterium]|nr:[protein-PII] uridylyltransferase [Opitutae bacterium]MBC9889276.1 [protein-PII] uridylyltransferase [Opitutae bacterium]